MQTVIHVRGSLYYRCPGCKGEHSIPVLVGKKEANHWEWNGDLIKPVVSPSVKHTYPESFYKQNPKARRYCCHYFIREGVIEYCGDSSHDQSGMKLPMTAFTEHEVADISQTGA